MLSSVISIIGLIGIGGLLKSLLDYYLNKNKERNVPPANRKVTEKGHIN